MKQILNLSKRLIAIPSTSDNINALKKVLEIAKEQLTGLNFKEFKKDNNYSVLFYNSKSVPKSFKLILNAHLDVVPAKTDQYKPQEKDGKLFGRGAYDMKTAAACMILLFKQLAKKNDYPLGLQLVTDEEVGGFSGTKYQIDQGIQADFVIAGENTDLQINHQSKGVIWLKVTTKGISAHGAYPWLGQNAIWKMQKILNTLEKLYPIPQQEMWCTTVNLSSIETSNKTVNKVPDECVAFLDIRYVPGEQTQVLGKLKQQFGKEASLEIVANEPAHLTDQSNVYLQQLIKSIQQVLGKEKGLARHHGGSDIRHYNKVGIAGVTFGPIGAGHHSDNEWVDIKSVEAYHKILYHYLTNLNYF